MREIKFRAWDVERKSWMNEQDVYNEVQEQGRWNPERGQFYKLMQFTGLYDKNGKEIYEGDVLKWRCSTSESKSKVMLRTVSIDWGCWPTSHGYAITIYINGEKYASGKSYWNNEDREIIGNIYENTELIKA